MQYVFSRDLGGRSSENPYGGVRPARKLLRADRCTFRPKGQSPSFRNCAQFIGPRGKCQDGTGASEKRVRAVPTTTVPVAADESTHHSTLPSLCPCLLPPWRQTQTVGNVARPPTCRRRCSLMLPLRSGLSNLLVAMARDRGSDRTVGCVVRVALIEQQFSPAHDDRRSAHFDALDAARVGSDARMERRGTAHLRALRDHDLLA